MPVADSPLTHRHVLLAAVWVYDHAGPDALNVTTTEDKAWDLDAVAEADDRRAVDE